MVILAQQKRVMEDFLIWKILRMTSNMQVKGTWKQRVKVKGFLMMILIWVVQVEGQQEQVFPSLSFPSQ